MIMPIIMQTMPIMASIMPMIMQTMPIMASIML